MTTTITTPTYILEWAISHAAYPEVVLSATSLIEAAQVAADRGLVTLDRHADGTVRPVATDAGRTYAAELFGTEGYQWLTGRCACATPHRI